MFAYKSDNIPYMRQMLISLALSLLHLGDDKFNIIDNYTFVLTIGAS